MYANRVYYEFGKPVPETDLKTGPNISSWPPIPPLAENLLLNIAAVLKDPVTTTDELIPSGEASTYRSNPQKLAEFTLARKDPAYVGRSKAMKQAEAARLNALEQANSREPLEQLAVENHLPDTVKDNLANTAIGSLIVAVKPGDGSAREQAASSQKMLGGQANIAREYATKRYRSNLINWGLVPFTVDETTLADFAIGDFVYIPGIRQALTAGEETAAAFIIRNGDSRHIQLRLDNLSAEERAIIAAGCLINYYRQ